MLKAGTYKSSKTTGWLLEAGIQTQLKHNCKAHQFAITSTEEQPCVFRKHKVKKYTWCVHIHPYIKTWSELTSDLSLDKDKNK